MPPAGPMLNVALAYRALRAHVPLLVSVAHRETLYAHHTHVLACSEGAVWNIVPMAEWLAAHPPTLGAFAGAAVG